jgi:DNA-binding transcriptional ArsR family regulator
MSFLTLLRRLLGLGAEPSDPATRYAHPDRRTRTGKLRARPTPDDVQRGLGADRRILAVPGLSASAKKVYLYLSAIADADGVSFPFYGTIARRTGLSNSTVGKALKELEDRGLLSRQQRVSRRGGSSNVYRLGLGDD